MARPSVYPQDFRDRAVNLVIEATPEHTSQWAAIETIGRQFGVSGKTCGSGFAVPRSTPASGPA